MQPHFAAARLYRKLTRGDIQNQDEIVIASCLSRGESNNQNKIHVPAR